MTEMTPSETELKAECGVCDRKNCDLPRTIEAHQGITWDLDNLILKLQSRISELEGENEKLREDKNAIDSEKCL